MDLVRDASSSYTAEPRIRSARQTCHVQCRGRERESAQKEEVYHFGAKRDQKGEERERE